MMDLNQKRENQLKLKTYKENIDLKQRSILKLEENIGKWDNLNKIQTGNTGGMTNNQLKKGAYDAAVDLNMKTDLHQDLIHDIGKNLYEANDNLGVITVEVKNQGDQIDRIHNNVGLTQKTIGRTDKRISSMNRRIYCHKLLLNMLIVVLFLATLTVLIVKLTRKVK